MCWSLFLCCLSTLFVMSGASRVRITKGGEAGELHTVHVCQLACQLASYVCMEYLDLSCTCDLFRVLAVMYLSGSWSALMNLKCFFVVCLGPLPGLRSGLLQGPQEQLPVRVLWWVRQSRQAYLTPCHNLGKRSVHCTLWHASAQPTSADSGIKQCHYSKLCCIPLYSCQLEVLQRGKTKVSSTFADKEGEWSRTSFTSICSVQNSCNCYICNTQ